MKILLPLLAAALIAPSALATTSNYGEIERKEAARKEQAKREFAQREKDRERLQRESQERLRDLGKSQSQLRQEGKIKDSKPGRVMDIK